MKKLAYLLLVVEAVNWTLFAIAAVAASAGVIIAKRQDSAMARSSSVLESNRNELNESIGNIVRDLGELTNGETLSGGELRTLIDKKLRPDLRRFAEARESMVHLYGLQTYADIMSEFAAGERYINRVWTSSADGYDAEAEKYLFSGAGTE